MVPGIPPHTLLSAPVVVDVARLRRPWPACPCPGLPMAAWCWRWMSPRGCGRTPSLAGSSAPGAFSRPRVPESDEVRSCAARISEARGPRACPAPGSGPGHGRGIAMVMTGRQCRTGAAVPPGVVPAACGWWADRPGYESMGLAQAGSARVLTKAAAAVRARVSGPIRPLPPPRGTPEQPTAAITDAQSIKAAGRQGLGGPRLPRRTRALEPPDARPRPGDPDHPGRRKSQGFKSFPNAGSWNHPGMDHPAPPLSARRPDHGGAVDGAVSVRGRRAWRRRGGRRRPGSCGGRARRRRWWCRTSRR